MAALAAVAAGAAPTLCSGADPAAGRTSPIIGEVQVRLTHESDTLLDLARSNNLGTLELIAANPGVDRWVPPSGTPIVLPTAFILPDAPRRGIVINVGEMRLYYFRKTGDTPLTFPIGIGRLDFRIPLGSTTIVRKQTNPSWVPTAAARADNPTLPAILPPGPNNPMGRFALYLGWATYAIHGTNNPWSVGYRVSRGCIRLYPEGIETLYGLAGIGTPVTVVDQPLKLAWVGNELFLEIHPSLRQFDELDREGRFSPEEFPGIEAAVKEAAGDDARLVDWTIVRQSVRERPGYPVAILRLPAAPMERDP